MNIGDLYNSEFDDWREARKWYASSLQLSDESGISIQKANILLRLADLEMGHGGRAKAGELIAEAEAFAQGRKDGTALVKALRMQVRLDSVRGDLPGALAHQKAAYALQDSLLGMEPVRCAE